MRPELLFSLPLREADDLRIYVDFDDVLCETARALSGLAATLFGRRVPYEAIGAFDLRDAFDLAHEQYRTLMEQAHREEFLGALPPAEESVATLKAWLRAGHDVQIVTGRPFATRVASAAWLERHGLAGAVLLHVDKYGREPAPAAPDAPRSLSPTELGRRRYDLAVEDAPEALRHLEGMPGCWVAIFDRPWNRHLAAGAGRTFRCRDWRAVAALAAQRGGLQPPPRSAREGERRERKG
jgi:hypothetical protein